VITGHQAHALDSAVEQAPQGLRAETIYNPFYDISGPIVSLWAAHTRMHDDDFLVCNGDTLYRDRALMTLMAGAPDTILLSIDRASAPERDDMKVVLDARRRLVEVGKDVAIDRADGVSTGLLCVRGDRSRRAFIDTLLDMIREPEGLARDRPWHSVLNVLVTRGITIDTSDVSPQDWAEADTPEELLSVQEAIRSGQFRSCHDAPTPTETSHRHPNDELRHRDPTCE
jgi:choline kinase